jgi:hypothetical protein
VHSLRKRGLQSKLRVYPFWSIRFDFTALAYGSQGQGPHPRLGWIDEEYNRIPRYQAQGDLASLPELWSYIEFLYKPLQFQL